MLEKKHISITIDVEDWFQVENLRPWFPPTQWENQEPRVERNMMLLLDLFDSIRPPVQATFFVLGWIARRFPKIVREITARGHELASHGLSHQLNDRMEEAALIQDLDSSKKRLEDLSGKAIYGYRAPSFSINDHVLGMIKQCGYAYDSSYNSFERHGRYGRISIHGKRKIGAAIEIAPRFAELPISNLSILGQVLPWGGGGYFRLLPMPFFIQGVQRIIKSEGAYIFYLHPWEIDPDQPRVNAGKGRYTWRHYFNLDKTYKRLEAFISRFQNCSFVSCRQYLNNAGFNLLGN